MFFPKMRKTHRGDEESRTGEGCSEAVRETGYKAGKVWLSTIAVLALLLPLLILSAHPAPGSTVLHEPGGEELASGSASSRRSKSFQYEGGFYGEYFNRFLHITNSTGDSSLIEVTYRFPEGDAVDTYHILADGCCLTILINSEIGTDRVADITVNSTVPVSTERLIYYNQLDLSRYDCYPLAETEGLVLVSPVRAGDTIGIMYHEASTKDIHYRDANARVLTPYGGCLSDDNPAARCPGFTPSPEGDPGYWIQRSRGRGTYSTTAVDVGAKAGCPVVSPVDGVVAAVEYFSLYGAYPGIRVVIIPDGRPELNVVLVHLEAVEVAPNERVRAGVTVLGSVQPLSAYFQSDIGLLYTREEGDHVHVQVNLAPAENAVVP